MAGSRNLTSLHPSHGRCTSLDLVIDTFCVSWEKIGPPADVEILHSWCEFITSDSATVFGVSEKHDRNHTEQLPCTDFSHAISCQLGSMPLPEGHAETMPQPSAKETRTRLQHWDLLQKQVIKINLVKSFPRLYADLTVCSHLWSRGNNVHHLRNNTFAAELDCQQHTLSPTTTPLHWSRSLREESTPGLWQRCDFQEDSLGTHELLTNSTIPRNL